MMTLWKFTDYRHYIGIVKNVRYYKFVVLSIKYRYIILYYCKPFGLVILNCEGAEFIDFTKMWVCQSLLLRVVKILFDFEGV
jgi:hypothetical protein